MARLRRQVIEDSDEEPGPAPIHPNTETTKPAVPARAASTRRDVASSRSQIRLASLRSLEKHTGLTIQGDTPRRTRKRSPWQQAVTRPAKELPPNNSNARNATPEIPSSIPSDQDPDEPCPSEPGTADLDEEESEWGGSEGEDASSGEDLPSPRAFFPPRRRQDDLPDVSRQMKALQILDQGRPPTRASTENPRHDASRPSSSSDKENTNAATRSPPPRTKDPSPSKRPPLERPSTPPFAPASPGKLRSPSRLPSRSKKAPGVPTPPLRPSLDAFWTAEAIHDWHDHYSPPTPLPSPRKPSGSRPRAGDEDGSACTVPPPRALPHSPSKRSKAEIQARREWEVRKHELAARFLRELDHTITGGRVAELSASTGGVQLVWSRSLNTTAGRAHWRRETTRGGGGAAAPHDRHFASIELAEKVLTHSAQAECKLLNVLAHEFCHLCTFMLSGVTDRPHGARFQQWGARCSAAFADRGVRVTTTHGYEIEYKYVWRCAAAACASEFKRHSKSIDPATSRCGRCRGPLLQIRPVPRATAKTRAADDHGAPPPPVRAFAAYVQQHFSARRGAMPAASHKQVMHALAHDYRAEKTAAAAAARGVEGGPAAKPPAGQVGREGIVF